MADNPFAPTPKPPWQQHYENAMLEVDPKKLHQKILNAETAIVQRMQELAKSTDSHAERSVISDAIRGLRVLKIEKLKFPDWT